MAFVVTESCIKCKYMDCVEVCPVDCFHEGPNFLVIDPDECIDCTLCEREGPGEAISSEEEKPNARAPSNGKACRKNSSCWSDSAAGAMARVSASRVAEL